MNSLKIRLKFVSTKWIKKLSKPEPVPPHRGETEMRWCKTRPVAQRKRAQRISVTSIARVRGVNINRRFKRKIEAEDEDLWAAGTIEARKRRKICETEQMKNVDCWWLIVSWSISDFSCLWYSKRCSRSMLFALQLLSFFLIFFFTKELASTMSLAIAFIKQ